MHTRPTYLARASSWHQTQRLPTMARCDRPPTRTGRKTGLRGMLRCQIPMAARVAAHRRRTMTRRSWSFCALRRSQLDASLQARTHRGDRLYNLRPGPSVPVSYDPQLKSEFNIRAGRHLAVHHFVRRRTRCRDRLMSQ